MPKFSRVLVPVQGHPDDDIAIRVACNFARIDKAKVFVVHVIEVPRSKALDAEMMQETARGEEALEQAELVSEQVRCAAEGELLQAREAGPAIVDEARDKNVDLIVMGLPYRTRLGEFYVGSTVNYILKHAPCRVWICREPMQPSSQEPR
jgi:nucleotide-binding universal stress UspA family protein